MKSIKIEIDRPIAYWIIAVWFISNLPNFVLGIAYLRMDWARFVEWLL